MAYQVLARKWRPQTFAEVVGQEHISRTLKNAIVQNRIGHAYLFVGSRGIGKTTTARIFAKALNCPNNKDGEPCCKCESCLEVANGSSMDVIEIDGASHNKVEDIRDIRDNVQYAPTRGRYKIYIIDEVHMLTVQAWNALLKTLEEPPPHVKFLFATTEPHKVLPTIVSRCQRFDLKRLSVPLIVSRLKQIAVGENINIEDAALAAIARAADGGMRDAQSIFDQIIAFCGTGGSEAIHEQDVIDVFGLASGIELREIAAAIFTNDLNAALMVLQKLADSGRDLERLYADLIEYVRNIMVAGLCGNASGILEVSETELTDLSNIGHALDPHLVQRVLQALLSQEWSFRAALNKRIYFEATLARVMLDAHSVQLDDVFSQLNRISGALPQTPMQPRPQIVIPPPIIQSSPQAKTENPKPQSPSGQTATAEKDEVPVKEAPEPPAAVEKAPEPQKADPPAAVEKTPEPPKAEPPAAVEKAPEPQKAEPPAVVEKASEPQAPAVAATVAPVSAEAAAGEYAEEEGAVEAFEEPLDINAQLMQASVVDMDDEADPALADVGESAVMASYTPQVVMERLVEKLGEMGGEYAKIGDALANLTPQTLGQYGLTLLCDQRAISSSDLALLSKDGTIEQINQAYKALHLSGKVKMTFTQEERGGERVRYRPASFLDMQRIRADSFVVEANRILGTEVTEGRVPENRQ